MINLFKRNINKINLNKINNDTSFKFINFDIPKQSSSNDFYINIIISKQYPKQLTDKQLKTIINGIDYHDNDQFKYKLLNLYLYKDSITFNKNIESLLFSKFFEDTSTCEDISYIANQKNLKQHHLNKIYKYNKRIEDFFLNCINNTSYDKSKLAKFIVALYKWEFINLNNNGTQYSNHSNIFTTALNYNLFNEEQFNTVIDKIDYSNYSDSNLNTLFNTAISFSNSTKEKFIDSFNDLLINNKINILKIFENNDFNKNFNLDHLSKLLNSNPNYFNNEKLFINTIKFMQYQNNYDYLLLNKFLINNRYSFNAMFTSLVYNWDYSVNFNMNYIHNASKMAGGFPVLLKSIFLNTSYQNKTHTDDFLLKFSKLFYQLDEQYQKDFSNFIKNHQYIFNSETFKTSYEKHFKNFIEKESILSKIQINDSIIETSKPKSKFKI